MFATSLRCSAYANHCSDRLKLSELLPAAVVKAMDRYAQTAAVADADTDITPEKALGTVTGVLTPAVTVKSFVYM